MLHKQQFFCSVLRAHTCTETLLLQSLPHKQTSIGLAGIILPNTWNDGVLQGSLRLTLIMRMCLPSGELPTHSGLIQFVHSSLFIKSLSLVWARQIWVCTPDVKIVMHSEKLTCCWSANQNYFGFCNLRATPFASNFLPFLYFVKFLKFYFLVQDLEKHSVML